VSSAFSAKDKYCPDVHGQSRVREGVASVAENAARGAAWNVATTFVTRGAGLVGTLLLTRFIAPSEFGEVSAASVCVLTAAGVTHLRFGQFLIAKKAAPEAAYNANIVHITLGIVAVGGVVLLRDVFGPWFNAPRMARFVPGFALTALIERLAYVPERILVRDLKFRPLSIARSVGEIAYTTVSLATAPFVGGMGIVFGNLVRSALVTGMIFRAARQNSETSPAVPSKINIPLIFEMFAYCGPLVIGGIAEFASSRWDNLLMSRYFGPHQLGMYNLAYNLVETPTGAIGEQVGDVLFPAFSKLEEARRESALSRATSLMALIVFPLGVGLASVSPTVVKVFFDERWSGVAPMLAILSVLSVARPAAWPLLSYLQAQHRQRALMGLSLAKVFLLIGAIVLFARFGPLWACAGVGATFFAYTFFCLLVVRVVENVRIVPLIAGSVRVLLACGAMGFAVYALRVALRGAGMGPSWPSLALEITVGAIVYVLAAFTVARGLAVDLVTQVRAVVRRKRGGVSP
jgi:PST family polysaccharide transporter